MVHGIVCLHVLCFHSYYLKNNFLHLFVWLLLFAILFANDEFRRLHVVAAKWIIIEWWSAVWRPTTFCMDVKPWPQLIVIVIFQLQSPRSPFGFCYNRWDFGDANSDFKKMGLRVKYSYFGWIPNKAMHLFFLIKHLLKIVHTTFFLKSLNTTRKIAKLGRPQQKFRNFICR